MKVLSVRQPWAYLIVEGYKDIENRKWRTSYRGPLLIHSSQAVDPNDFPKQRAWLNMCGVVIPEDLPRGAIVGLVNLIDVWDTHSYGDGSTNEFKVDVSPFFEGPYGFKMIGSVPFYEPIPYRGQLGIREASDANLTGDLFESLEDALEFNEYLLTK